MLHEPAIQLVATDGDAFYLLAPTLFDDVERFAVSEGKVYLIK